MPNAIRYLFAVGFLFAGESISLAQTQGPTISHEPITVAARGQAISVLARVQPGSAAIKTVTLHYTPSRDASPIKQPMTPTGGEVYVGTIPTTHLATTPSVHYYLEAVNLQDEWAETPWTQIQIRDARAPADNPRVIEHSAPAPVAGSQAPQNERQISTATMIGGGVLAAGAAVAIIAAADSGGGGGGSGSGGDAGGDSGGDTSTTCTEQDAVGTWTGIEQAPGFVLALGGSAQFFATVDGVPEEGSWGLTDCRLTLIPFSSTNSVYRGSGEFSEDKNAVTINGVTYTRL